ncbi:MAG: CBS domain-containing protein, partial [Candidatus Bathyarchaeia archaeon]
MSLRSDVSVEQVMRSPPLTALFSDTVSTVVDRMLTFDIGAVVVESGGQPVGIITEKDILQRVVKAGRDPSRTLARDVMTSPIVGIEVGKSIKDALKLMREKNVRRLGVTRAGRLIGIVTERRVLDALVLS